MFRKYSKYSYVAVAVALSLLLVVPMCFSGCQSANKLNDNTKYHTLDNGSMNYTGFYQTLFDYTKKTQLQNADLWKQFVDVYRTKQDSKDLNWRCEYWGKMMRGAVMCYKYQPSDELYLVLEATVKDMLSTADEEGRITTYTKEKEFQTWDIWGRKYIMTSMLGFLEICKDNSLKNEITTALKKHADYIVKHIGKGENQKQITDTSIFWLGVNSASILEPFVNLFEVTGDQKYLDFAKYIVETGGIKSEAGNLIDICKNTSSMPYQYPEVKAYETMSFFEGVYRYALITKNDDLKNTAIKFFNDVENTEITVTGNAGNDEEAFNNAAVDQTHKPDKFSQETCVAVTWMRIQDLLYRTTGELKYYENLNKTGLNAFLGNANYYNQTNPDYYNPEKNPALLLPFDSYSPLDNDCRGKAVGGLQFYTDTNGNPAGYYGCCACISAAAVALISSNTVIKADKSLLLNNYFDGTIDDGTTKLTISGSCLSSGKANIKVDSTSVDTLKLRIPSRINGDAKVVVDGEKIPLSNGCYTVINKPLKDIKNIDVNLGIEITETKVNDKTSLRYGDVILALDQESNPSVDIANINVGDLDLKHFTVLPCQEDDLVRLSVSYKGGQLVFKSYSSCGKHWNSANNHLNVFLNR